MLYQSKVLLVDDNKTSLYVLSKILQKLRCNVISAENGKNAMNILKMNNFNLVIIESRLPDMKGVDLLQQMMNENLNVKKIVLTGYPSEEDKIKFFELGADYYLSKPIKPKKLLQIIKNCVNL